MGRLPVRVYCNWETFWVNVREDRSGSMKKCVNPDCQRALRYSDDKTHCPLCHSRLRTESNSRAYSYRVPNREMIQNREDIPFITRRAGRINCHGRVIEVDCEARFHNRFHKLCNTFSGENRISWVMKR